MPNRCLMVSLTFFSRETKKSKENNTRNLNEAQINEELETRAVEQDRATENGQEVRKRELQNKTRKHLSKTQMTTRLVFL